MLLALLFAWAAYTFTVIARSPLHEQALLAARGGRDSAQRLARQCASAGCSPATVADLLAEVEASDAKVGQLERSRLAAWRLYARALLVDTFWPFFTYPLTAFIVLYGIIRGVRKVLDQPRPPQTTPTQ